MHQSRATFVVNHALNKGTATSLLHSNELQFTVYTQTEVSNNNNQTDSKPYINRITKKGTPRKTKTYYTKEKEKQNTPDGEDIRTSNNDTLTKITVYKRC